MSADFERVYDVAVGDLDGDGRPDLAASTTTGVFVFRNSTVDGAISFAPNVYLRLGVRGTAYGGIALGDLDGDRKPELVVANRLNYNVSVFPNTATRGVIDLNSFATNVDFRLPDIRTLHAADVALGDFDNDGKLDLAVAHDHNISAAAAVVFRNEITGREITANSFASHYFSLRGTAAYPRNIAAGDLDGDGKPDLVLAPWQDGVVTVLRNIASPGEFNSNSFAAPILFPVGGVDSKLAIGDLDSDGKPEIVAANCSGAVTVFRNVTPSLSSFPLLASTDGGGGVVLAPPGGVYPSNATINVTAMPAPGWTFLHWLGDVTGTNPVAQVQMNRARCVQAVFGTPLNTEEVGSGFIYLDPIIPFYPYGCRIRCTAFPVSGHSFILWTNASSSTNNPLDFVVTDANPTLTALFQPLASGEYALVVIDQGNGRVTVSPPANCYPLSSDVTLTALPSPGQTFAGWSGDASGTDNPMVVSMTQTRKIVASFTARPRLSLVECAGTRSTEALQLLVSGEFGARYHVEASTDLANWTTLATLTNSLGVVQFDDPLAPNFPQRFYRVVALP